jgi:tetratricopeptide (TPR) repeat protein
MKPKKKVENAIRQKLRFTAAATLRDRWWTDVLDAQEEGKGITPALHEPLIGRTIMRSPIVKLTSVAAVIAVAALALVFWGRLGAPAYAIEQTVAALQNARFLHVIGRDPTEQITDERWIEIGMDGWQVRYRQQNPLPLIEKYPGAPSMVIEDGSSTAVYRGDKKAVIIYDRKDQQYQWVGELGKAFENLRQEGKVLEENTNYKGRPAHKVWWPYMSAECYVDPQTKLPFAIGSTELSYEEPPVGTFEIVIPDGYAVLDKRPGAPTAPVPQWLLDEESAQANKDKAFREGSLAYARGDYAEAATQFQQALGSDSWAPFWLGSAYYHLGKYDLAIENYNKEFDIWTKHDPNAKLPYCSYARGLAYAKSGHLAAAKADFQACLPEMIRTLRTPSGGMMFEYAENTMVRYGQGKLSDEAVVVKMVNRLRVLSGQNFGYDPSAPAAQKEAAIAAWERWFKNGGQIKFTPDAPLLPVPTTDQP